MTEGARMTERGKENGRKEKRIENNEYDFVLIVNQQSDW